MTNQMPPQDIDAEESVLASCMLVHEDLATAIDVLAPEDFYKTQHQKIFSAISDMANRNQQVDLVALADSLKSSGQLENVGGAVYLAKIMDTAPIVPNMAQYCEIIKNLAIKRRMLAAFITLQRQCYDHAVCGADLLDAAQQAIQQSEDSTAIDSLIKAGDLCMPLMDTYMKVNQSAGNITGLASKFQKLDDKTGGFQKTDLVVIAARPGMGKTAFALDLARAFSQAREPVLFVSLEMSREQLVSRMVSKLSGVDSIKLRSGGIRKEEWSRITDAMESITLMPLYIDQPRDNDFDHIRRKIRRAKREMGISVVVIDYLQLMSRKGDYNRRNDLMVGSMTRDLKHLATDLEFPIILLSQLNRALESRSEKEPILSDLRESGAIEQDADLVMFLYRDEVYNKKPDNPRKGTGDLIVAKHRHGPTGKIVLQWHEATATYRNFIKAPDYSGYEEERRDWH